MMLSDKTIRELALLGRGLLAGVAPPPRACMVLYTHDKRVRYGKLLRIETRGVYGMPVPIDVAVIKFDDTGSLEERALSWCSEEGQYLVWKE